MNAQIIQLTAELEDIKNMLYQQDKASEALKKDIVTELELKASKNYFHTM